MYMYLSVYLSIYLSIRLSIIYLSIYHLSIYHLSIYLNLSVYPPLSTILYPTIYNCTAASRLGTNSRALALTKETGTAQPSGVYHMRVPVKAKDAKFVHADVVMLDLL